MSKRVAGVRELKARLSHYLDVVREEGPVTITERGRPVARLVAVAPDRARTIDDVLAEMAADGLVELGEGKGRIGSHSSVGKATGASGVIRRTRR